MNDQEASKKPVPGDIAPIAQSLALNTLHETQNIPSHHFVADVPESVDVRFETIYQAETEANRSLVVNNGPIVTPCTCLSTA